MYLLAVNGPAMSPVASPESSPPESGDGSDDSPTNPSVTGKFIQSKFRTICRVTNNYKMKYSTE